MNNELLKKIFYDAKIGFNDLNKFYDKVKYFNKNISYNEVKAFYENQKVNQVFKENEKKHYHYTKAFWGPGGDLKADIMDVSKFRQYNDEYGYILVIIDVYSRYAWAFSLYKKKAGSKKMNLNDPNYDYETSDTDKKKVVDCFDIVYKEIERVSKENRSQ